MTVLLCLILSSAVACTAPVAEYVLAISSTEGGSVTKPGEGRYTYCKEQGLEVSLVATPDAGYRFVNWTGDVSTIADVNSAATTITMNGDYSITANFEAILPEYDLTVSSTEGGSVTNPGEGTFTYDEGTVVNLVARADSGYGFVKWTGDVSTIADVNSAVTAITMNGDNSIKANFGKLHNLSISSTYGGSVAIPGMGIFTYVEGTVVNLVAVADEGFRFAEWLGDVTTIADVNAAVTTITMNGDYEIMARFYDPSCGCPVRPGG
ncbi:MAG: InlB B-repeat-containing protein [Dehalococcoidia bacterium]